jgi:hypothetical protein
VRQEEIGADQHVGIAQLDVGDAQPGVLDLLAADREAVEGGEGVSAAPKTP